MPAKSNATAGDKKTSFGLVCTISAAHLAYPINFILKLPAWWTSIVLNLVPVFEAWIHYQLKYSFQHVLNKLAPKSKAQYGLICKFPVYF